MSTRAVDYFETLATSYGRSRYGAGGGLWHRYFFGGRLKIALGWLAELSGGGVVADVGAGPGPLTSALDERGCRTIAIDGSFAMARTARGGGAEAAVGDALALPLRDGACDAAVALGLASYVDDLTHLMRELGRVVRPGGLVIVSVATSSAPDWFLRRALRAPAVTLGAKGVLTSGVELRTRRRPAWRAAAEAAGLSLEAEKGHDFTLFPLSRLLPGPAVMIGRAFEALDARALDPLASEVVLRLRVPPARPRARSRPPRKIVRVIARLNVGGPAMHTVLLTRGLAPRNRTVLATGDVGPGEAEATHLLERFDVAPRRIRGLGRKLSFRDDVRAFAALSALIRRERPDVVHTHTAKAGALGRVAAWLANVPAIVHTFHGHVFHGYFSRFGSALAVLAERALARLSDCVLGVSEEVCDDLVARYRIAPREKVRVVPIGLPLAPFVSAADEGGTLRRELGMNADEPLALMVGRLVPVKQPELALDVWRRVRAELPNAVLAVVGAGQLLEPLRARAEAGVRLLGWRADVAPLVADADVALLTSRNEGTPVALIEAAAARVPAVATRVGGVPSVVEDGVTGLLADDGDAAALAAAVVTLLRDPARRVEMGRAAQERVLGVWSDERLIQRVAELYEELGACRSNRRGAGGRA